jgi:hypothetical protein
VHLDEELEKLDPRYLYEVMMENAIVVRHADPGTEDESQSRQECDLEVHRASNRHFAECPHLAR